MTVWRFERASLGSERASACSASAMTVPPAGPRPLLLSLRTRRERAEERKGTSGSTERPPNALSLRSISTSVGLSMSASQMAESAGGISEIRRPVKMSAKFATWRARVRVCQIGLRGETEMGAAHPEMSRLREEVREGLCGLDTDGVPAEMDLLDHSRVHAGEVRLDVGARIEFETLAEEREDGRHGIWIVCGTETVVVAERVEQNFWTRRLFERIQSNQRSRGWRRHSHKAL